MRQITRITDNAIQNFTLSGDGGEEIKIKLRFIPSQKKWMIDISEDNVSINGLMVGVGANIIRNFRNIFKNGIAITTLNGFDPSNIDDFVTGEASFFLLNSADVKLVESTLYE